MVDKAPLGPGEAADRARRRRMLTYFGVLAAIGFTVGFSAALIEGKGPPILSGGTIPPWFAILGTVVTLGAMIIGSLRHRSMMDELDQREGLIAGAVGGNILLAIYPAWFLLWKGGLLPEPQHLILFLIVLVASCGTFLVRKFL